jgi:low temperature requirement protein LtrA
MIFNKEKIRLLLSKPTLADNSDIEKKATWLELYFDLFFVAIIGVISHHFAHLVSYEWSWIALMRVVIEIVTLTWIWSSITYFFDRYESKGLTKRLFFLVQMFILAMLGLTIEP